ncbi:MAG TPA: hypothetical protein VLF93_00025 [Candidatus Saccharimonadales bacterium]|nr:hypothetical protein [Candidatus Saccharimonadales bacterium]
MKTQWEISVPQEEVERIAVTYGDPADALIATKNYALYPLPEAITNWHAMVPLLTSDHWYDVTAFYSRRKADLSPENAKLLYDYNQKAYDAAKKKDGLILYYQGVLLTNVASENDSNLVLPFVPNCLSFCIWKTLPHAKEGAKVPAHKKATKMTSLWFDGFSIIKYQVMLTNQSNSKFLVFKQVPKT